MNERKRQDGFIEWCDCIEEKAKKHKNKMKDQLSKNTSVP